MIPFSKKIINQITFSKRNAWLLEWRRHKKKLKIKWIQRI
jgi:hypothetical protein